MKKGRFFLLVGLALALGGCAAREDVLASSSAGYVEESETVAASVDWSTPRTIEVNLSEYEFSPAKLTFRRGVPYRLIVRNTGRATHYFVSEDFFRAIAARSLVSASGVAEYPFLKSVVVPPGAEKEILFVPAVKGEYALRCTAPFHALFGMTGKISIN